jgi:hypothetical protein
VVREILASTAQAQRALGQFEQCLTTIEKILDDDPASRHVVELPLVWDERLPAEQRIRMTAADLQAASPVRQLTAASALIHEPEHQAAATATLQALRKTARGQILELSEAQLWRARLLQPRRTSGIRSSTVEQPGATHLDRRARSGPEFVIGRALLAVHDYDNAATSLLWMPLLEPLDPPTTEASLQQAITALELSGRSAEAARLRAESSKPQ